MGPTARQYDRRQVTAMALCLAVEARIRAEHVRDEARRTRQEVRRALERLRDPATRTPPDPPAR
jgi:hypothetical protein